LVDDGKLENRSQKNQSRADEKNDEKVDGLVGGAVNQEKTSLTEEVRATPHRLEKVRSPGRWQISWRQKKEPVGKASPRVCQACGKSSAADAAFCQYCGNKLAG